MDLAFLALPSLSPTWRLTDPGAFALADPARRFVVRPGPGIPAEAVLQPAFWGDVASSLRRGDGVEVVSVDGSYDLELRVIEVGPSPNLPLWARIRVLRAWPATETIYPGVESFKPVSSDEWCIEHHDWHGWVIVRPTDGQILLKGFTSQQEAQRELEKLREKAADLRAQRPSRRRKAKTE